MTTGPYPPKILAAEPGSCCFCGQDYPAHTSIIRRGQLTAHRRCVLVEIRTRTDASAGQEPAWEASIPAPTGC